MTVKNSFTLLALASLTACGALYENFGSSGPPPHYPGVRATKIYVTNACTNAVLSFGAGMNGNTAAQTDVQGSQTTLDDPFGIFVDASQGVFYVANTAAESIVMFPLAATGDVAPSVTISGANTGLSSPEGVYVDGAGTIWVADTGANAIEAFAAETAGTYDVAPVTTIEGKATGLNEPVGIWEDSSGNLWISNFGAMGGNGAVEEFAATSIASGQIPQNLVPAATISYSNALQLESLFVDARSNVWAASFGRSSLEEFTAGTTGLVTSAPAIGGQSTGIGSATGVAVDGQGFIYEASLNEPQIQVFAPTSIGNVAPVQSIANSRSLTCPEGLALQ